MSFDIHDIRRPMDVFTLDDVYLGTIREVVPQVGAQQRCAPTACSPEPSRRASEVSGESLGPAPTADLGNPGPDTQGASNGYAAGSDGARPIGGGTIVVGRWGRYFGGRTFSMDDVLAVSLERVVLKYTRAELPGR